MVKLETYNLRGRKTEKQHWGKCKVCGLREWSHRKHLHNTNSVYDGGYSE